MSRTSITWVRSPKVSRTFTWKYDAMEATGIAISSMRTMGRKRVSGKTGKYRAAARLMKAKKLPTNSSWNIFPIVPDPKKPSMRK